MTAAAPFFQGELGFGQMASAPDEVIEIAPFRAYCAAQPAGSNWCWAAISRAMLGFAKQTDLSLEQVAAQMGDPAPGVSEMLDVPFAFSQLGLDYSAPRDLQADGRQWVPNKLAQGRPVAATIAWFVHGQSGDAHVGHVIALFGCDTAGTSVLVFDPNTVGNGDIIKLIPISELEHYLEGSEERKYGIWSTGYAVSRDAG